MHMHDTLKTDCRRHGHFSGCVFFQQTRLCVVGVTKHSSSTHQSTQMSQSCISGITTDCGRRRQRPFPRGSFTNFIIIRILPRQPSSRMRTRLVLRIPIHHPRFYSLLTPAITLAVSHSRLKTHLTQ